MMVKCEKCDIDMYQIFVLPIRLVGGVHAILCERCATEWNEFASAHPMYQELRRLEVVRNSIAYARELSVSDIDPLLRQVLAGIQEVEAALHEEGLRWIGRNQGEK
jgi:hypothetical protein